MARTRKEDAQRKRAENESVRDIGEIPPVVDPERRARCEFGLVEFCITYLPETFYNELSEDHIDILRQIQACAIDGGMFIEAIYRGFGKSSIAEAGALWATLYGHRKFVCIVGPDLGHAVDQLDSIRAEIEENELIGEDFPEVCFPVRALEGVAQRAPGQLYNGERTYLKWKGDTIVFPSIPGSISSGSLLRCRGITAKIRGMKHKRRDGRPLRPDFVIIDDPQTQESAKSASECDKREDKIANAIQRLAGHDTSIALVMPCTIIYKGDLVDRMMHPTAGARYPHHGWTRKKIPMLRSWPENMSIWEGAYASLIQEYDDSDPDGRKKSLVHANKYLKDNWDEMHKGASVSWEGCYNKDCELSAVQHAMNIFLIGGERVFNSECQNTPADPVGDSINKLEPAELAKRVNRLPRGVVPVQCAHLAQFIDWGEDQLHWMVCAWAGNMSGAIIDYGIEKTGSGAREGATYAALDSIAAKTMGKEYEVDGGGHLRVSRCHVDSGGGIASTIYQWCRENKFASITYPSKGEYMRPGRSLIEKKRTGAIYPTQGEAVLEPIRSGRRAVRLCRFDANWYKTFAAKRLLADVGSVGAVTLFGDNPRKHSYLVSQLTSEYCYMDTALDGSEKERWQTKPARSDNHLWDCFVGCCVVANFQGCVVGPGIAEKRAGVSLASWFDKARRGRR